MVNPTSIPIFRLGVFLVHKPDGYIIRAMSEIFQTLVVLVPTIIFKLKQIVVTVSAQVMVVIH